MGSCFYKIRRPDGTPSAPLTLDTLTAQVERGRVGAETWVCNCEDSRWVPAWQLPGLQERFASPQVGRAAENGEHLPDPSPTSEIERSRPERGSRRGFILSMLAACLLAFGMCLGGSIFFF